MEKEVPPAEVSCSSFPTPAPSLGSRILDTRTLVYVTPWTMLGPGVVIVLFVVGLNLLGGGLRDTLHPRNRGSR
jgi:peptide/nickel transport system permease protein